MPNNQVLMCPHCGRRNDYANSYCSYCGGSLVNQKRKLAWQSNILEFTDESRIPLLLHAMDFNLRRGEQVPEYTNDEIRAAFNKLSVKEAQVVIRQLGLDGNPSRSFKTIGKEYDLSDTTIRDIYRQALSTLKNSLLGYN